MAAVIHLLCETNPSFATSLANGLLAAATVLGGCMAFGSGLPAAISLFVPVQPAMRTDAISKGTGRGFIAGIGVALLTLFVFIARLVS
jgi:hypothetical protein